jgi:Na+/H+ antiporter NhaD/arsenite permease-like protein
MPQPDPIPSPRQSTKQRYWRIFRLLILLSIVVAIIAVILVTRGAGEIRASLIIATALGTGFTVLVGTGLMALLFISNSSGHDEEVARVHEENEEE